MKKCFKYFFVLPIFLVGISSAYTQEKYIEDVQSLDQIIKALYDVISGDKAEARDLERFKFLFAEDARLIPTRTNPEGLSLLRIMTPDDYIQTSGNYLVENGFFEKEINRKVEEYGSLVHVWSTYESYRTSKDTAPFMRGINSIQLLNDGNRWWILQIYWLGETKENPLPEKYLPKTR